MKTLTEETFVIFDVETTGLSPMAGDRIVEIAAMKLEGLRPLEKFHSLVNPQREISWGAYEVNHISQEMVEDAPTAQEVLPSFLKFAEGACLVAHNAKFDLGFLVNELSLAERELSSKTVVLDTLKMARGLMPSLGSYSLASVARALSIDTPQRHRAMADVEMTVEVFMHLIKRAQNNSIDHLGALLRLFSPFSLAENRDDEKLSILQQAIINEKSLNMVYFSPHSGSSTFRKVTPRKLLQSSQRTKLIAFCHLRNEEREFRLDRIVQLESV
jgi:DNA polymerase III epsilon subunit